MWFTKLIAVQRIQPILGQYSVYTIQGPSQNETFLKKLSTKPLSHCDEAKQKYIRNVSSCRVVSSISLSLLPHLVGVEIRFPENSFNFIKHR